MGRQISVRIKKTFGIFLILLLVASLTATTVSAAVRITKSSEIDFAGYPKSGDRPLTVYFWGTAPAYPATFYWDFGDGQTAISKSGSTKHVYTEAGGYGVSLRVTYPLGGGLLGGGSIVKPDYITVYLRK